MKTNKLYVIHIGMCFFNYKARESSGEMPNFTRMLSSKF